MRTDYRDTINYEASPVEATKTVLGFTAKLGALGVGTIVGVTKATAMGIRSMEADKDSYFGEVSRKSVRSNYRASQVWAYDMCTSLSDGKEKDKPSVDEV